LRFSIAAGTGDVSLFRSVRGRGPGKIKSDQTRDLNQPCRSSHQHQGRESWLERKRRPRRRRSLPEAKAARTSYWGRAGMTFRIRGVFDPAKRPNDVRPLLL